jgi:predicted ATPase
LAQISPELQLAAYSARPSSEVGPDAARAGLVRSLVAQLREAVGSRPLLLIVDDAQWCDTLSLSAIERLVASLRSWSIGVLATLRDDGAHASYARAESARGSSRIR